MPGFRDDVVYSPVRCRATNIQAVDQMMEPKHETIGRRNHLRIWRPFSRCSSVLNGSPIDGQHGLVCLPETACMRSIPASATTLRLDRRRLACRQPHSTASTCFRSPRIASRRSIPTSGRVLADHPLAALGRRAAISGLAWAEGTPLGRAANRGRQDPIQIDPNTGAILRTIESNRRRHRGSPWIDGELWHGNLGKGDESDLRRVDIPRRARSRSGSRCRPGVRRVRNSSPMAANRFFCGRRQQPARCARGAARAEARPELPARHRRRTRQSATRPECHGDQESAEAHDSRSRYRAKRSWQRYRRINLRPAVRRPGRGCQAIAVPPINGCPIIPQREKFFARQRGHRAAWCRHR